MKKTRILSIVLAVMMLCALMTGCMGGKTVLKVNGNSISEDIFKSAIAQADSFYQQNYGFSMGELLDQELQDGKTGADMLKEEAEGLVKEFESVRLFAKENGITLTAEDKKSIDDAKQSQIDSAGSRKAFVESLEQSGVNEAYYDYIMESQMIYQKLYTDLFTGEGQYAPSAEMIAENLSTGYARIKHVLIQAAEGDEDYAEKKAKAEDVAKRAAAGEDFEALIAEFGEDPGMESNTEGYIIDEQGYTPSGSQMITEFTEASFKLAENGVSGLVPSTYGFHIIKRYPLNKEYALANYENFVGEFAMVAFSEEMSKYMETITVERTAAFDSVDVHSVLGVDKVLGAGVDVTEEHYEGDGHDHSAEGEVAEGEATEGGIEVGEAVPAQ